MTINWPKYGMIRKLNAQGKSERTISTAAGVARDTVRRYKNGERTPDNVTRRSVTESDHKQMVKKLIATYLEENKDNSGGKQKIKITTIYREINTNHIVNYTMVKRCYHELIKNKPNVFIPLDFEPGEVMQVDWFEVNVIIGGLLLKVPVFIAVLPFSYMFYTAIMPEMTFESFIAGHLGAFSMFQGITERIHYDNLKAAVYKNAGPTAIKQKEFKKFEDHYCFEAVFMNRNKPNEKGAVEKAVQIARDIIFTPYLNGNSLQELQDINITKTINYIKTHKKAKKDITIFEHFQIEKKHMLNLPMHEFSPVESIERIVDKTSMVQFNASKYSAPEDYVGKTITILCRPYTIELWHDGVCIAIHERAIIKDSEIYNPRHLLKTYKIKPRAIRNAAPLTHGKISSEMSEFLKPLGKKERNLTLFNILILEEKYSEKIISTEIKKCNLSGVHSFEILKSKVIVNYTPVNDDKIELNDNIFSDIDKITVPLDSLDDYNSLIGSRESRSEPEPEPDPDPDKDEDNEE